MLRNAIAVGRCTVTVRPGGLLLGQFLLRLFKAALFTGQFLVQNMATVAVAGFLGIFLHTREA